MSPKKTVAVSFAWKEENDGAHRGLVDSFCDECQKKGFSVTRDSLWLTHGDDLSKFMREQVGKAGVLVLFLSDAYIRSHNCMYEYLVAWNHDYDDPDALAKRLVLVSLLPAELSKDTGRWAWAIEYWKELADEQSQVRRDYIGELSPEGCRWINRIDEIKLKVSEMLTFTGERLHFHNPQDMGPIVAEVQRRLGIDPEFAGTADDVFARLIRDINKIIARNSVAHNLVRTVAPFLLNDGRFDSSAISHLTDVVDGKSGVTKVFEDLYEELEKQPIPNSVDAEQVQLLIGGLLILTIAPEWIHKWHRAWTLGELVSLPVRDFKFSLGIGVDGSEQEVSMLAVFRAALSRACARLDELFEVGKRHPRQLAPLELVSEGISEEQVCDGIRLQLIRQIAPSKWNNTKAPSNEDKDERNRFDDAFIETLDLLMYAANDEKSPWVAADASWSQRRKLLVDKLGVRELLIIEGQSDRLRDVFPDCQRKLLGLRKVWRRLSSY